MECSRDVARGVLRTLIRAKVQNLCGQNEIVRVTERGGGEVGVF